MALAEARLATAPQGFRAETVRGTEGFFRVAQDAGDRWWLVDPAGRPFFAKAVHDVQAGEPPGDGGMPMDSAVRLRNWGFNAVGLTRGSVGRDDGLPFLAAVEFCEAGLTLTAAGMRLPDVFDPKWPGRAADHARERCGVLKENPALMGWVTDSALGWAQPSLAGRPSLLQICLSLEPSFAAYHAAWEFVLALHGGRLETLARAWGASLPNKEVVRELTRAEEGLGTRGYLRDEARWTREFARRYFTGTAAAVRRVDPNHLVLGCRFADVAGPAILAECAYPAIDVALPDWRELGAYAPPTRPGGLAFANPILAGNVSWTTPEFLKLPAAARLLRLTSVEWMLRRGRSGLDRLARNPAVVGYVWAQWQDAPAEQPPFAGGLVHQNGIEAREHTELLAQFNRRADSLRRFQLNPPSP